MLVEIENFQKIKKQKLDIKGFTLVKGETSLGKSSTRRVIESVLLGGWDSSYLKRGEKFTYLHIKEKDFDVRLEKSISVNRYTLNNTKLDKAGIYPQAIKELGYDQELNISTIYKPLFLIGESRSEVTKKINSITGMSLYENIGNKLKVKIRDVDTKLKIYKEELKEEIGALDRLMYVKNRVSKVEDSQKRVESYKRYIESKSSHKKRLELQEKVETFVNKLQLVESLSEYLYQEKLQAKLKELKERLDEIGRGLDKAKLLEDYRYNSKLVVRAKKLRDKIEEYESRIIIAEKLNIYIELNSNIKTLKSKDKELVKNLSKIDRELENYKCKTCGQWIRSA